MFNCDSCFTSLKDAINRFFMLQVSDIGCVTKKVCKTPVILSKGYLDVS